MLSVYPRGSPQEHKSGVGSSMDLSFRMDLGMAVHRIEDGVGRRQQPVQLDLLPMHPLASHSASPFQAASASQISLRPRIAASRANSGNDVEEMTGAEVYSSMHSDSPRGLDMNQVPSSDCEDAAVSSPNSILSPFHIDHMNRRGETKRDRDECVDLDAERDKGEATSRASDDEDSGMPRKKLRLSKEQSALLEESFREHTTLNPKQKAALAKQLNLRPRQVEVWFQNRRARTKLKQTEMDCEILKRCCETLTEENRRLQKELQELRAIKVPPACVISQDFYMPLPAATLTMCPSCERLASVDNKPLPPFAKPAFPSACKS